MLKNTLSKDEFSVLDDSFTVYPNPSSGMINITVKNPTELYLYSISGKKIKTFSVESTLQFSVNLASGIYILRDSNTNLIKKIVIN